MPPSLLIERQVKKEFVRCLRKAGRREIGGILFGEQLEIGKFRLVDFSTDGISGSAAHFCRFPQHHNQALEGFFQKTGRDYSRFNYLGEWHSHPSFPVQPSAQDIHSMNNLVRSERGIPFSALLIVRLDCFFFLQARANMFSRMGAVEKIEIRNGN